MNYSFVTMSDLENRIASLKRELELFKSGKKYISMKKEYSDMLAYEERTIRGLKEELAATRAQIRKVRENWYSTCEYVASENSRKMKQQETRIKNLEKEVEALKLKNISDRKRIKEEYEEKLEEKDAVIEELKNKLAHCEALLNIDSTNSGIPTAQTPLNKKKIIPNTREKSQRLKGGQPGHTKHTLEVPDESEINSVEEHKLGEDDACCNCGNSDFEYTGESNNKYIYDIEIKVKKVKHVYYIYRCQTCGQLLRTRIEPGTREKCQYGPAIQALALSLTNTSNSPINKTAMFLKGITGNELSPCEGYISKLQRRAATGLKTFMNDLRRLLITRPLLYWDDTVIMIKTKRGCLRFYGDEQIAYYTAHNHKDLDSLEDDEILKLLTKETTVMHDHNTVNYNERFSFSNIECNQHLQRDLKKSAEETNHKELLELKELISETIHERKELIKQGIECFEPSYINDFHLKVDDILDRAEKVNIEDYNKYSGSFERAIINRMKKYRDYYFEWLNDFSVPTTNNLSERALRCVKSHMKISGQFESEKTAGYYATIKSYIETCRRNGINEVDALTRLSSGNPYTVKEIFQFELV